MLVLFLGASELSAQSPCPTPAIQDPTGDPGFVAATVAAEVDTLNVCTGLCDTLDLTAAENPSAGLSTSVTWRGPDGFSQSFTAFDTDRTVHIPFSDPAKSGDYIVEVTYIAFDGTQCTSSDTLNIQMRPVVDWQCPTAPIVVTPDLSANPPSCARNLASGEDLMTITGENCDDNWSYEILLCLENGGQYSLGTGLVGNAVAPFYPQTISTATDAVTAINTFNAAQVPPLDPITDLPFGNHSIKVNIVDPSPTMFPGPPAYACDEVVQQCIIDFDVLESINNLACNDLVNVTLTDECEAIITPAMVLEGDYCFDNFTLELEHVSSETEFSGMGQVIIDQTGMYNVTVTGQSGLSCWGQVLAEDKSIPQLNCDTVQVFCTQVGDLAPGTEIKGWDRGVAENMTISNGGSTAVTLDLTDISGTISNVILNFELQIDDVSDVELSLTSPEGTVVDLLDLGGFTENCENANINVCLSDAGEHDHSMFARTVHCRWTENAFIGSFKPLNAFSAFNGEDATNTGATNPNRWTLTVTNNGTTDATLVEADLQVTTSEGSLLTSSEVIQNTGCDGMPDFRWEDEETGTHCAHDLWTEITRTWTVVNSASSRSETCEQIIEVKRYTADDIIWPKDRDNLDTEALTCDDSMEPGQPMLPCGNALSDCGNFQVSGPNEIDFPICGNSYKRIYTWTILDWCVGEIVENNQVVKVEDDQPLIVTCPPDDLDPEDRAFFEGLGFDLEQDDVYMATTNPGQCSGDWSYISPLVITNPCDDNYTIELTYLLADPTDPTTPDPLAEFINDNVQYDANGNATGIDDLPGGQFTWLRFLVTDECGNTGECRAEVYVKDETLPNPICIENTVVALGTDGCGYLPAESIDNMSWDNCGIDPDGFSIRRADEDDSQFRDQIEYCCSCENPEQMVVLRVTDLDGNTNTCQTTVRIQNNRQPTVTSTPPSVMEFQCTDTLFIGDHIADLMNQFDATGYCSDDITHTVELENASDRDERLVVGQCGEGGYTVKFIVKDECGNQIGGSYSTTFTFDKSWLTDPTQFQIPDSAWPSDQELTTCTSSTNLRPSDADFDRIRNGAIRNACTDLAITYEDLPFHNVDNACLKILRTWTVVDWCIAANNSIDAATRSHTQEIKVFNNVAPVIDMSPICVETVSENCEEAVDSLVVTITDDCTDMFTNQVVTVDYTIDFADGSSTSGSGTVADTRTFSLGTVTFPVGVSTISFWAEDHCGNRTDDRTPFTTTVEVKDVKAPTPYCRGSVVTATMPVNNGEIEIWAEADFDLGGVDNCDDDLDIYFLDNGNKVDALLFDCEDIVNGQRHQVRLQVYYEDDAGNSDYCEVILELQDNANDVCPNTGSMIAGNVHTEELEMVEEVMISIGASGVDYANQMMTEEDGEYAFTDLANSDYKVSGEKEDHPLNGVSTLDLVLIQKHILGIESFGSPYKIIAADANDDSSVTALDLIEIRKVILGVNDEFPNGQKSWRFPEANQTFVNPAIPFPYNEEIRIIGLDESEMDQDFVAVKIGDVNATATVNAFQNDNRIEKRTNRTLDFAIENVSLIKGSSVEIPVYADNMEDIIGFQTTLNFDTGAMTFEGYESGAMDMQDSNFGLTESDNGTIAISWNSMEGETYDADEPLFYLNFFARENMTVDQRMYLSSSVAKSEAYTSDLSTMNVGLNVRGHVSSDFVLYQNVPNPFSNETQITFSLPGNSDVTFTVYDLSGREIVRRTKDYTGGTHSIVLSKDELDATSVMYYKIESSYGTASKKMIQIR